VQPEAVSLVPQEAAQEPGLVAVLVAAAQEPLATVAAAEIAAAAGFVAEPVGRELVPVVVAALQRKCLLQVRLALELEWLVEWAPELVAEPRPELALVVLPAAETVRPKAARLVSAALLAESERQQVARLAERERPVNGRERGMLAVAGERSPVLEVIAERHPPQRPAGQSVALPPQEWQEPALDLDHCLPPLVKGGVPQAVAVE